MKVLFAAHNFPRFAGDVAGAFLLSLAQGLTRRGHELMVVAPHDAGLPLRDEVDGITVRRFRYGSDEHETLAYRGTMADQVMRSWGARIRLLRFLAAFRSEVATAAREWSPNVIHAHWWFPAGLVLPKARRAAGAAAATVLTSHGTDLFLVDRIKIARAPASRVFRAADRVTVISTPLVGRVTSLNVAPERISVIPMPADRSLAELDFTRTASSRDKPFSLLFAGRLIERKGAEYAIRALRQLVLRGVDATLTVIGDGPLRLDLDDLCDELQLGARVHFTGTLAPKEVLNAMRAADVFLMPAVTDWKGEQEGFGMVIVEAMLSGLPVVASASGGILDIVEDGTTGILVPERDAGAIADAAEKLYREASLGARLAADARANVLRRFHPDSIAGDFEKVYLQAVEAKR